MTDQWTDRLSEYLDQALSPEERRELETHLDGCDACRETVAGLERVVGRARQLEDRPPARDLWPGIAARIGSSGPATRSGEQSWTQRIRLRRLALSVPQLMAAGVALAVVSAGTAWVMARDGSGGTALAPQDSLPLAQVRPVAGFTEGAYQTAVRDLERALAEGRDRLDTGTVRVVEQSLQAIDAAIMEARRALAADPSSAYLNDHLAETMRRKLDLMRRAAALAMAEL